MTQIPGKQNRTTQQISFLIRKRLVSLDVFRGIAIAFMILIGNLGGDANYMILQHAEWNGLTLADIFFPFFLFIVGVAIPYSLSTRLEQGQSKKKLLPRIIRRAIVLFALGVFINGFPYFNLSTLRIMGVLQRIAICYLAASTAFLTLKKRKLILTTAFILLLYWALMTIMPVPGYGPGALDKNGNLAAYVDKLLLPGHLYLGGTWDPEGLLSTLPAIATTMLGVITAIFLRSDRSSKEKSTRLLLFGVLMIFIGGTWNFSFPINKNLWTSSFVALTGGMALIVFSLCYYTVDFKRYSWWTKPFIILGLNAITAYVLTEIMNLTLIYTNTTLYDGTTISIKGLIYQRYFASWAGPLNGSLLYGLAYLLLWMGIMTILYKRRIFIKV